MTAGLAMIAAAAANLLVGGDFTDAKQNLSPVAFANGGRASLVREDGSWNSCGCIEVTAPTTNSDGIVT